MISGEKMADRQVAVLIDFENVGLASIQWLFDQVSDIGRIIVKKAYADWSIASNKRDQLLEFGIEAIHVFRSASGGKNSSDIRLVIDAVELLYQSPVDTFVIVSSDSDFVPLVSKLRAAGKTVIGAGRQAVASATLVKSCDRYFYLDEGGTTRPRVRSPKKQQTETLLIRAVKATIDEEGRAIGSKLHQTLQRLDPGFDFRSIGYSTFTNFLEASPGVKVIRPKGPGDVTVELAEPNAILADIPSNADELWEKIDTAWLKRASKRPDQSIPGPLAAADAAGFLGVPKLSASQYKTLQGLLEASNTLNAKWSRNRNTIVRRESTEN